MIGTVQVRTYPAPPVDRREIVRYMGARELTEELAALLEGCLREAEGRLQYRVCFREVPVCVADGEVDLGFAKVPSAALARNLAGCRRAVVFAATMGLEMDRLIARYSRLQPVKGLMFQAIGTERVEALCDAFCADMDCRTGGCLRRRFSPGYGDLPLELQRDMFRVLDCSKNIGLTLNGSLLMSPTKSVTAIAGIADAPGENHREEKCAGCDKPECMFRNL